MHLFKRREYSVDKLHKDQLDPNPVVELKKWLRKAAKSNIKDSNAMVLSTSNCENGISSRVVLLKEVTDEGLVFFTNYGSKKALEIEQNNQVGVTFYWAELEKQVRIQGIAIKLDEASNNNYFRTRDYKSQIASIISPQSSEIESRHILVQRFKEIMYRNEPLSRPENWGGYIIEPTVFEFWQGRKYRLNDRLEYFLENGIWKIRRLAP
jgi:pyridoxamine 5'-phosphate oxidase